MARFVTRRMITMFFMLFAISLVTFLLFIVALPGGNPAAMIAGRLATPAEVHLISVRYGFDKPIYVQYVHTMAQHLRRQRVLVPAGLQRAPADRLGPAGDAVARDRRGHPLAAQPRSRLERSRRSARASTPTGC